MLNRARLKFPAATDKVLSLSLSPLSSPSSSLVLCFCSFYGAPSPLTPPSHLPIRSRFLATTPTFDNDRVTDIRRRAGLGRGDGKERERVPRPRSLSPSPALRVQAPARVPGKPPCDRCIRSRPVAPSARQPREASPATPFAPKRMTGSESGLVERGAGVEWGGPSTPGLWRWIMTHS